MSSTEKLRLGDIEVARIGLGTNRLTNTPENVELIREAVAAGVNVVDTAHTYSAGESEATIGAALSPLRADVVVATKGGWNTGRPETIQAEIRQSLRRLRTASIALYYLHRVDSKTPIAESLGAIKECRDRGQIRHVGLSNVSVEQIERLEGGRSFAGQEIDLPCRPQGVHAVAAARRDTRSDRMLGGAAARVLRLRARAWPYCGAPWSAASTRALATASMIARQNGPRSWGKRAVITG